MAELKKPTHFLIKKFNIVSLIKRSKILYKPKILIQNDAGLYFNNIVYSHRSKFNWAYQKLCMIFNSVQKLKKKNSKQSHTFILARRAGSDGSMSASGSAGLGFDPRRGCKFSFENFQPRG